MALKHPESHRHRRVYHPYVFTLLHKQLKYLIGYLISRGNISPLILLLYGFHSSTGECLDYTSK